MKKRHTKLVMQTYIFTIFFVTHCIEDNYFINSWCTSYNMQKWLVVIAHAVIFDIQDNCLILLR